MKIRLCLIILILTIISTEAKLIKGSKREKPNCEEILNKIKGEDVADFYQLTEALNTKLKRLEYQLKKIELFKKFVNKYEELGLRITNIGSKDKTKGNSYIKDVDTCYNNEWKLFSFNYKTLKDPSN